MENHIEYQAEELLAITARLAKEYTSFESSSVTYETAQVLMEAVTYCIRACYHPHPGEKAVLAGSGQLDAEPAYRKGFQNVTEKVYLAKTLYEELMTDFENYGCWNYRDTLQKGMPGFFLRYDPKFQPQNHLLTLDYPVLGNLAKLCGIDLIYEYLQCVCIEIRILDQFSNSSVKNLLDQKVPDYQELFLDNICGTVIEQAVKCMIADVPVHSLVLDQEGERAVKDFFKDDDIAKTERKIGKFLEMFLNHLSAGEDEWYFKGLGRNMAVWLAGLK